MSSFHEVWMKGYEDTRQDGKPILSDRIRDDIIECSKFIPRDVGKIYDLSEFIFDGVHYRRKLKLICRDYRLTMALRQTSGRPEDFSVILMYESLEGSTYIIKRYNGSHGIHRNRLTGESIEGPHIHTITERYQVLTNEEEGFATPTNRYETLSDAVKIFISDLNISYETARGYVKLDRI